MTSRKPTAVFCIILGSVVICLFDRFLNRWPSPRPLSSVIGGGLFLGILVAGLYRAVVPYRGATTDPIGRVRGSQGGEGDAR